MVNAEIFYGSDGLTAALSGHAGFAPKGQDIVCAGISALALALTEALNIIVTPSDVNEMNFKFNDGEFFVNISGIEDSGLYKAIRSIFLMFQLGLSKISESYPENISVNVFNLPLGDDYNGTSEQTMTKERKEEKKWI